MKMLWIGLVTVLWSTMAFATTPVCVTVQQKSWYRPPPEAPPRAAPAGSTPDPAASPLAFPPPTSKPAPPTVFTSAPTVFTSAPAQGEKRSASRHEIDPTQYLKRMLEYEVTHEVGFAAVDGRCDQRLSVDLYQLESGWTVFARYSGTEREEKVAHVELDEFGELAQRIAFSLLRNRAIGTTITRENVLRDDSEKNLRTIDGTGHFIFGMGTAVRMAKLATAQGATQPTADQLRVLTPLSVQVGYRRKLRAWGLDVFGRLNLGTENTGIHRNDLGGHIDYAGSGLVGLHFLRYADAPGINSFYFGGGAAFELAVLEAIRPLAQRMGSLSSSRESLLGGGLNLDVLMGYEFLRASSVHFFGQIELNTPTYLLKTENDSGAIDTYMPGALAQIGIIF
ncbi:MAG TPA: hypothetical protein VFH73_08515 [Polyangia bacterium]|jgi:hypothetical protein|nr:hypothetical protein [Polyangia bacterium]